MKNERRGETGKTGGELTLSRLGLASGAAALGLSTAFMNVSGWVAQAQTTEQQWLNGVMSGGMELFAASAFGWAGYQLSRRRWMRASGAAIAGAVVIYFNTLATQNFLHEQEAAQANRVETSGQSALIAQAEIARLETERDSLIAQSGGEVPRPVEVVEAAYAHLDPDRNPINMSRKNTEIGLRLEYERLQDELTDLRAGAAQDTVQANDAVRTVVPKERLPEFIWAMEGLKAGAFFLLGTSDLAAVFRRTSSAHSAPSEPPREPRRSTSKSDANRRRWAIVRAKRRTGAQPGPLTRDR